MSKCYVKILNNNKQDSFNDKLKYFINNIIKNNQSILFNIFINYQFLMNKEIDVNKEFIDIYYNQNIDYLIDKNILGKKWEINKQNNGVIKLIN